MELGLVSAVVALVSAVVTKQVSDWVEARGRVADANREARIPRYETLWEATGQLSMWPRSPLTWAGLGALHRELRQWYYEGRGGLYLSEHARARYGDFQELMAAYLYARPSDETLDLPAGVYTPMMKAGSALRTALTEDLESRSRSSVILSARQAFRHAIARRAARRRLSAAPAQSSPR